MVCKRLDGKRYRSESEVDVKPKDLIGKTLRLVVPKPSPYTIAWRVYGYGSGSVRLVTVNSKTKSETDWSELVSYIRSGYLEVLS